MSLTRWEPIGELMPLREAMDRLFLDSFFRPFFGTVGESLAVDIIERENEYIVRASVPGYDPSMIDVKVQGNVLTLRGTMEETQENGHGTYYLRERRYGSFERSVQLPGEVNADKARAEYRHGVLTLHLPKAERTIPKKIPVKVG